MSLIAGEHISKVMCHGCGIQMIRMSDCKHFSLVQWMFSNSWKCNSKTCDASNYRYSERSDQGGHCTLLDVQAVEYPQHNQTNIQLVMGEFNISCRYT